MSILKYLQKKDPIPSENTGSALEELLGPRVLSEVNETMRNVLHTPETPKSRGKYAAYSPQDRAMLGKYCAEHGATATIRKFKETFPNLSDSTVRSMRSKYNKLVTNKKRKLDFTEIDEIQSKKRGRPLLLGCELDQKVQHYIKTLRENGAVINTAIVLAAAHGIVASTDKSLLTENGGSISFGKNWAKSLLSRMNMVKRKGSTSCKADKIDNFDELKTDFLCKIEDVVSEYDIPSDMIINWDHAGLNVIPVSDWTMEVEGRKRVEIAGLGDKRQITAIFAGSLKGTIFFIHGRGGGVAS